METAARAANAHDFIMELPEQCADFATICTSTPHVDNGVALGMLMTIPLSIGSRFIIERDHELVTRGSGHLVTSIDQMPLAVDRLAWERSWPSLGHLN